MMEKESVIGENNKAVRLISIIRDHLHDQKFKEKHRTSSKVFVRNYKINFVTVILLVLRKSVKSAQLVLNEFFKDLSNGIQVTSSAFTQARKHLQYQAFITLNKNVIDILYSDFKYYHFKGFRVLSIDGSKIHLPNTSEIDQEFGTIQFINGKTLEVMGQRGYGLASVMYDVLNKVVIVGKIAKAKAYEVDLALEHLQYTCPGDLLLFDRGYPSYLLLATLGTRAEVFRYFGYENDCFYSLYFLKFNPDGVVFLPTKIIWHLLTRTRVSPLGIYINN